MFHGIGQVDAVAFDSGLLQRPAEQPARRPDKRAASVVFLVAWLLTHHHHRRRGRTFAADRLAGVPPQATGPAIRDEPAQLERSVGRAFRHRPHVGERWVPSLAAVDTVCRRLGMACFY